MKLLDALLGRTPDEPRVTDDAEDAAEDAMKDLKRHHAETLRKVDRVVRLARVDATIAAKRGHS